jgi:hypothetical protein
MSRRDTKGDEDDEQEAKPARTRRLRREDDDHPGDKPSTKENEPQDKDPFSERSERSAPKAERVPDRAPDRPPEQRAEESAPPKPRRRRADDSSGGSGQPAAGGDGGGWMNAPSAGSSRVNNTPDLRDRDTMDDAVETDIAAPNANNKHFDMNHNEGGEHIFMPYNYMVIYIIWCDSMGSWLCFTC